MDGTDPELNTLQQHLLDASTVSQKIPHKM